MKLGIYCIFDSKALVYARPMYLQNDQIALRMAHDVRNNPETDIHRHAEDFTLFKLGTYDDGDASFDLLQPKITMLNFAEIPLDQPDLFQEQTDIEESDNA